MPSTSDRRRCAEGLADLVLSARRSLHQYDAELPRGVTVRPHRRRPDGIGGIVHEEDALQAGDEFLEELEPLGRQLDGLGAHAGDVGARSREAPDEAELHRVAHHLREDDRLHRRGAPRCDRRVGADGEDDVRPGRDEILRRGEEGGDVAPSEADADVKVLVLADAEGLEAVAQPHCARRRPPAFGQDTDPCGLLRLRPSRPEIKRDADRRGRGENRDHGELLRRVQYAAQSSSHRRSWSPRAGDRRERVPLLRCRRGRVKPLGAKGGAGTASRSRQGRIAQAWEASMRRVTAAPAGRSGGASSVNASAPARDEDLVTCAAPNMAVVPTIENVVGLWDLWVHQAAARASSEGAWIAVLPGHPDARLAQGEGETHAADHRDRRLGRAHRVGRQGRGGLARAPLHSPADGGARRDRAGGAGAARDALELRVGRRGPLLAACCFGPC